MSGSSSSHSESSRWGEVVAAAFFGYFRLRTHAFEPSEPKRCVAPLCEESVASVLHRRSNFRRRWLVGVSNLAATMAAWTKRMGTNRV